MLNSASKNVRWIVAGWCVVGMAATVACGRGDSSSRSGGTSAQAPAPTTVELKVGDPAPPFDLAGSDGRRHKLSDYKGRTVVLAWFAKAFTSP